MNAETFYARKSVIEALPQSAAYAAAGDLMDVIRREHPEIRRYGHGCCAGHWIVQLEGVRASIRNQRAREVAA